MVNQVTFCVKLDDDIAEMLEKECLVNGKKRNRIINIAIDKYISMLDLERRCNIFPQERDMLRDRFLRANFPGLA